MATLGDCMRTLETKHGGVRKAANHYGMDKGYWKRLRDGEKKNPSADMLHNLGIREERSYSIIGDNRSVDLAGVNEDLKLVFPGKPVNLGKAKRAGLDLGGWEDAMGSIDIDHLYPCTEEQMLAHLAKFKGRGVQNPNYREAGAYAPQWKCHGAWYWWQKGASKGEFTTDTTEPPIEAAFHHGRKLYAAAL